MKKAVVILCLFALVLVGYLGIYPQVKAYVHWRRAQAALQELDFGSARHDLETCASVWTGSGETHFLLARACRRQGDLEAALAELHKAKELHWVEQQLKLEDLLLRTQAGAIKSTQSILRGYLDRGDPESRLILEALVVGCLQANFLQEAFHWASAWCKNFPDDWEGHYLLGNVLLAGLSLDMAAAEYEEAVAENPRFLTAHGRLADVLRRRGRFKDAVAHYDQVLARRPDDRAALLGRARCRRDLNQAAQARSDLDRLLSLEPRDAGALRLRGELELDHDNPQAALDWLLQANATGPDDKATLKTLSNVYERLHSTEQRTQYDLRWKELDQADRRLDEITSALAKDSADVSLRYEAARILLRLGHRRDAIPWLTSILQIDPKNAEARKALLETLEALNDPALAATLERLKKQSASEPGI